jgi:P-type conjugative transfer protein TrbJ
MKKTHLLTPLIALGLLVDPGIAIAPETSHAGPVPGLGATEVTQILNNVQLVGIQSSAVAQLAQQVQMQINQVTQIMHLLNQYNNMVQNTLNLPNHIWGNITPLFNSLAQTVQQGQALSYALANVDNTLRARFGTFSTFSQSPLSSAQFSNKYADWSETNQDTIAGAMRAANLQYNDFSNEQSRLAAIQSMSQSSDGVNKSIQVANQIAVEQVQQMQKLRQLSMSQMQMTAAFQARYVAVEDAQKAARDKFFTSKQGVIQGDGKGW